MDSKKRQREDDDSMEVDEDILIEQANPTEFVNVEIVFSCIRESNYHNIRDLLKPLFLFEDVNVGDIADLLIQQGEDVGTTIKTEDEEETKNLNVEIFGVFSYLPLKYYESKAKIINKLYSFLKEKISKYASKSQQQQALNIIETGNLCLLINERAINLPQEVIPPAMKLIKNEIEECKSMDDYNGKFEFEYVIIISKFVKLINKTKGSKKQRTEDAVSDILFYKYDTNLFLQKAVMSLEYRINYKEKNLDYLENSDEPQYINILLIKASDYYSVLNKIIDNK